jgi:hypothetical protein
MDDDIQKFANKEDEVMTLSATARQEQPGHPHARKSLRRLQRHP